MKPTENYEQLIERFTKRIKQLGALKSLVPKPELSR